MEPRSRAGMTHTEALASATWGARDWLRRPGIAEGEDADLVVLDSDPREDVRACATPRSIVLRGATVG